MPSPDSRRPPFPMLVFACLSALRRSIPLDRIIESSNRLLLSLSLSLHFDSFISSAKTTRHHITSIKKREIQLLYCFLSRLQINQDSTVAVGLPPPPPATTSTSPETDTFARRSSRALMREFFSRMVVRLVSSAVLSCFTAWPRSLRFAQKGKTQI